MILGGEAKGQDANDRPPVVDQRPISAGPSTPSVLIGIRMSVIMSWLAASGETAPRPGISCLR